MKIGILTFNNAYNYGAILQCFALQKTLKIFNEDVDVINYQCPAVLKQYQRPSLIPFNTLSLKKWIMYFLKKDTRKKFDEFKRQKLYETRKYDRATITNINLIYDLIFVGSDQVWNGLCTNYDTTYFLDFSDVFVKKCSYAASFGKEKLDPNEKELYKPYLEQFHNISVREESGENIISELVNKDVQVVVDPVYLLTKTEWERETYSITDKYIYVHLLVTNDEILKWTRKIADKYGYEVYIYSSSAKSKVYGKQIINMGLEDFLSYIKNAQLIITDSFHCSSFSLIFNKPFYSILREKDPANTRIENLVKIYGVEDNIFSFEKESIVEYDYNIVNKRIHENKEKSLEYIQKCLGT